MNKKIVLLSLLLTSVTLSGCGLKGPLYFPAEQSRTEPVMKADPAKAREASSQDENQTDNTPATAVN